MNFVEEFEAAEKNFYKENISYFERYKPKQKKEILNKEILNKEIWFSQKEIQEHFDWFGTRAKGKSKIIENYLKERIAKLSLKIKEFQREVSDDSELVQLNFEEEFKQLISEILNYHNFYE